MASRRLGRSNGSTHGSGYGWNLGAHLILWMGWEGLDGLWEMGNVPGVTSR